MMTPLACRSWASSRRPEAALASHLDISRLAADTVFPPACDIAAAVVGYGSWHTDNPR
jgi:hypothetical protein